MCQDDSIKPHSIDDVDIVINPDPKGPEWMQIFDWCFRTESWSFCPSDYSTWLESFEDFWYFMAIEKKTGEAIGSVTLARTLSSDGDKKKDLYSVGMYYVRPEWRSSGVGTLLFDKLMTQAGDHNMCLNGVLKMSPRYASKYGFDKIYEPKWMFFDVPCERVVLPEREQTVQTKDIKDVDYSLVHEYDKTIMPNFDRYDYMKKWLHRDAITRVSVDSSNKVNGICCIRPAGEKLTIGPFYAENKTIANSLLADTVNAIDNWKTYKSLTTIVSASCTEGHELFTALNNGIDCSTPFCVLQFTRHILPAQYNKAFGIMECASSFV